MKILLLGLFALALVYGVLSALPPRLPTTTAATVSWELADIAELGELRLLTTEIASYQQVTLDPQRYLKAVIPVRVVLGMDLTKAQVRRDGVTAVVRLPAVRFLHRSSDPTRWNIWEVHGVQQLPSEKLSMAHFAELRAFAEADAECLRLGLVERAKNRAIALLRAWLTGLGATAVRFE